VVGVIYIDTALTPHRILQQGSANKFTQEHLKLMIAIAHQAALAVEDTSYYKAMVQAERLAAVGQTIASLSHHIKNILQGVRGGSYLIELGIKDHAKAVGDGEVNVELAEKSVATMRKGWNIVERNQERISALVMDMLTFSKERQPVLHTADLNETVSDVCELLAARAAELGVALKWSPAPELPPMNFDAEGIHRAVLNIVTNALDAVEGREGGTVRVAAGFVLETGMVAVVVADNGLGIAPEQLPQLFNIFESTKGARGTGIGLAVSQKIIREHGGDILVDSRPGEGARFTLEWPMIEPEAEAAGEERATVT
jgi:signal transduction histidine kinase